MTEPRRAVFLDRDGTINEQMGYINHLDRFVLLPGVGEAIRKLNQAGLPVIVVSNQAGAARGYFPIELIETVHVKMKALLEASGARIDAVYYCPHHPRANKAELRKECECRKPMPGMFLKAAREQMLDLKKSFVVGDRHSDLEAARTIGATAILVKTGYGLGELEYILPERGLVPDFAADDLNAAVDWILARIGSV